MRIVNIMPQNQYFSYAATSKGGKTLKPGELSPELPIEVVVVKELWRDINAGHIQIRLNKQDEDFIRRILVLSKDPLKSVKPAVRPPKPVPVVKVKKNKALVAASNKLPDRAKDMLAINYPSDNDKPGVLSLGNLMRQNAKAKSSGAPVTDSSQKSTLREIETHMKGIV